MTPPMTDSKPDTREAPPPASWNDNPPGYYRAYESTDGPPDPEGKRPLFLRGTHWWEA